MSDITYENIICEKKHNGQECIFSKKALTKLKMLATIGTVSALAVVTFSGCTNIRKDVEQLTTTQPTSSYVQMMEETNTTRHTIEETTRPTTTQPATQPTTQPTTQENTTQKETQQAMTTTKKTIEQTTVRVTQQEVEKTTKEVEQTQTIDKEYNKLFKQLNKELNKKSFSKEVNKLFIDTFERLYENYPTWQKGYKDLPSREEYIKSNLIDIIKDIDKVNFYKEGSKKANKLEEEGNAFAWTTFDENDNLTVEIIAKEADKVDEEERNRYVEFFYHEIIHCKQKNTMIYSSNYFEENEDVKQLYLEGGATFHMKFTNPLTLDIRGIWSIENEKGDLTVEYNKDNGSGYLVDLNAYEKMVYLVGYNTMDKIEKGEIPLSVLEETITKKYGKKQASKFLKTMKEWYVEYNNSYKGDKIYNLAIEFENTFLECVKQDINSLKTEKQIKEYKKIWEHYKTKNLPQVTEEETNNITNEIFNIKSIDNMLKSKEKNIKKDNDLER